MTDENPPGGVRTSSRVLCGRCSADRWLLDILAKQRVTLRGRVTLLAKQLTAGGYPRSKARSDGEPSMLARARSGPVVALADALVDVIL